MSTRQPYPGRPTKALPREELAPISTVEEPPETRPALEEAKSIARAAENDIVTMMTCPRCNGTRASTCAGCAGAGLVPPSVASIVASAVTCPCCVGAGSVPPEVATIVEGLLAQAREKA